MYVHACLTWPARMAMARQLGLGMSWVAYCEQKGFLWQVG
jgi:hypothetical protein